MRWAVFDHRLYLQYSGTGALSAERSWAEAYCELGRPDAAAGFQLRAVLRRRGILQGQLAELLAISRPTATRALRMGWSRRSWSHAGHRLWMAVGSRCIPTAGGTPNCRCRWSQRGSHRPDKRVIGDVPLVDVVAGVRGACAH